MTNTIKYIGFYQHQDSNEARVSSPAACNKMNYIAKALNNIGYKVNIISPSWLSGCKELEFSSSKNIKLRDGLEVTYLPTFSGLFKLLNWFGVIFTLFFLFCWGVKNIKKGENIIVYHSPWLVLPLYMAKKVRKFNIILEAEEVYSDVSSLHPIFDYFEELIFRHASSFILSTELLSHRIDVGDRHFLVVYGDYQVHSASIEEVSTNKVKLIYAGIIDKHKKGAFNAVDAAGYLSDKYEMSIIGFGDVDYLKEKISQINEIGGCQVHYEGVKSGVEFNKYVSQFNIGLSTQSMTGNYLQSSFPSKILTYLGLGLNVISCNVECVRVSTIGDLISYYKDDTPRSIATAIENAHVRTKGEITSRINSINTDFMKGLERIYAANY